MNRERLFARLGPTVYGALVDATALGRSRRHAFVDLDHWALCLLKREHSDLALLLAELNLDVAAMTRRVELALARVPASGDSMRDISPVLERSVAPAITWSQICAPATHVRSGHLLLAWLDEPSTLRWLQSLDPQGWDRVSLDDAVARFERAASQWPEAAESSSVQATGRSPLEGELAAQGGDVDALARWAICMTHQAARGELDPVVGRDNEMRAVTDILLRRRQNNPILVGEAGVGKTAIVEGLAQQIHAGRVPPALARAQVWALDITRMQAGASARGEFEQRLRSVMDAVAAAAQPVILFCDEAHMLIGAGGQAGTGDAVNLIKPMLARGQLRMVAATTWSEYKQFIEPDAALVRRFQPVPVDEPDDPAALDMLRTIAPRFAAHHGVHIADAALAAAVSLSRRHLPSRQLPDKAISLLDTACARVAMSHSCAPAELDRVRHRIQCVDQALLWRASDRRMGLPVCEADEDLAAERAALDHRATEIASRADIERRNVAAWMARLDGGTPGGWAGDRPTWVHPWVDEQSVAQVLSEWTGVPPAQLAQDDAGQLTRLHSLLMERVHGQQGALGAVTQAVQVSRSGLGDPRRPLGVLFLAGPTGSGKSQTAAALAELLYGGERQLIQFNMNEFQEGHTVSTLRGAPPGYVGHGKGGRLTEAVRKKPYSVVLLDEFDRAHPDVQEVFYQVFDQGWMEDGEGRRISFRNCLILMTSNLGDAEITAALLANPDVTQGRLDALARERLQKKFPPPLLARMHVLAYRPLTAAALASIAVQALAEVGARLATLGIDWHVDDGVAAWIANAVANHPSSGRAVQDLLRQQVMPRIAEGLLQARAENRTLRAIQLSSVEGLELSFDHGDVTDTREEPVGRTGLSTKEEAACA